MRAVRTVSIKVDGMNLPAGAKARFDRIRYYWLSSVSLKKQRQSPTVCFLIIEKCLHAVGEFFSQREKVFMK